MSSDLPPADTRNGRERRQEMDDGPPGEAVYFLPSSGGDWGRPVYNGSVYHTNPGCRFIAGDSKVRKGTRQEAQDKGLAPCAYCVLGMEFGPENGERTRECTFCGAAIKRYRSHLPCEDSP